MRIRGMLNLSKENIVKDLGPETLFGIEKIIFQSVLLRIIERLSDDDADNFEKLLEEKPDDEEAILSYLRSKNSNFDIIVNEEADKFKKEAVDFMNKIKE
ncbi:hypothetical protein KJ934_00465 [Patescibacteria group bacterium]|nr:hypothetical protein [Patescibacteria group bacterium]MBU4353090.1 hypothetical protein [Patescibacteria group bacterium]MBU4477412.1 hypothetical protein [Patescibacteria group bacterium]MCG2699425.1 hypothetical protein [Candidatus Parcubacteria bacterium]